MRTPRFQDAGIQTWMIAALAGVVILSWQLSPLLLGDHVLFFRDLGSTHVPAVRLFGELRAERINPYASFGQPYLGNPNLLVAYRMPMSWTNVEAHLLLHAIFGFAGMVFLLRAFRASPTAAFIGAVTYSFSGYVLSSLSFLNATTTIAWLPWVLRAAAESVSRRLMIDLTATIAVMAAFSLSGEPALIFAGAVLAIALAWRNSIRRAVIVAGCGLAGSLLVLPVHLETWRAARVSARVIRGFGFEQASAQSMHPMRLIESILPGLFGSPSQMVEGGWWGFRFSGDRQPYVHSVALLLVPLGLALSWLLVTRFRQERLWVAIAAVSLVGSMFAHLPFAAETFDSLRPLRLVRYPIKLFLFFTLAISVLAARGFDCWWSEDAPVSQRRTAARMWGWAAALALVAALTAGLRPGLVLSTLKMAWDSRWISSPDLVLTPIAVALPGRLLFVAIVMMATAFAIKRPRNAILASAVVLLVTLDAVNQVAPLLPSVARKEVATPSRLVAAARNLSGPVCELAWKDLDPVRRGLRGRYRSNAASELAIAQVRQAWALSGAPLGIRYAYNNSPDGSYTMRNQLVQERIEEQRNWEYTLKWLRASGAGGVIAPTLGPAREGVTMIAVEDTLGIPARLYKIENSLPMVRSVRNVVWARSSSEAVAMFEDQRFDERTTIVVETAPRLLTGNEGVALLTRSDPGSIEVRTDGTGSRMLFVARSYTSSVRAWVNDVPAPVLPANVHLLAVPVPGGSGKVRIRF